jgi:hypothetical protein
LLDTFHVGQLKKFLGETSSGPGVLPPIRHGRACLKLAEVIESRLACSHHELLVRWTRQATADAAWMDFEEFCRTYPTFELMDDLILQGRRDVMYGISYQRCGKQGKDIPPPPLP